MKEMIIIFVIIFLTFVSCKEKKEENFIHRSNLNEFENSINYRSFFSSEINKERMNAEKKSENLNRD